MHAVALLGNRVYQALSTSFAGSTEYMALEEMSRHVDSGRYDLVIVDTPPAAHALDFVSAPDRIAPLVERGVVAALARPAGAAGTLARFVARRIEGATGAAALAHLKAQAALAKAIASNIKAPLSEVTERVTQLADERRKLERELADTKKKLALAGGGLKMGQVIGDSNSKAEVPATNPIGPQDLMATVLKVLGVDPQTQFVNQAGRPVSLVEEGHPIAELT